MRLLALVVVAGCVAPPIDPAQSEIALLRERLAESERERARLAAIVATARKRAEAEWLLKEGIRFGHEGNYRRASALLRAALDLDPRIELVERIAKEEERVLLNIFAASIGGGNITRATMDVWLANDPTHARPPG